MDGGRKKRKMEYEEEDEDAKIEQFFALIKSTRQLRDLLRGSSNGPGKTDQNKKEDHRQKGSGGAWNPAFRPEDFLDQDDKSAGAAAAAAAGPSKIQEEEKKEDKGGIGLDLKLSL